MGVNVIGGEKKAKATQKNLSYITCYNYDKKSYYVNKYLESLKKSIN